MKAGKCTICVRDRTKITDSRRSEVCAAIRYKATIMEACATVRMVLLFKILRNCNHHTCMKPNGYDYFSSLMWATHLKARVDIQKYTYLL
jgi:hypothetical protein